MTTAKTSEPQIPLPRLSEPTFLLWKVSLLHYELSPPSPIKLTIPSQRWQILRLMVFRGSVMVRT